MLQEGEYEKQRVGLKAGIAPPSPDADIPLFRSQEIVTIIKGSVPGISRGTTGHMMCLGYRA